MTKRRLTQKAVANSTHSGALAAISGRLASWALPANTNSVMPMAWAIVRWLLTMATPVTRPQAAMPSDGGAISRAPRRNSGWAVKARSRSRNCIDRGGRA